MIVPDILHKIGWNRRILTLDDFTSLCAKTEVKVLSLPIDVEGFYTHYRNRAVIGLSQFLPEHHLPYVSFHELGHHLLHHPGIACFDETSVCKAERQANIIAACALIPQRTIRFEQFADIEDALNLSHELVLFRAWVWQTLKL